MTLEKMIKNSIRAGVALIILTSGVSAANAALLVPTPYLSFADSPFFGGNFSYFYLEDFEDGLFNTPGVTASAGGVTSVVFGPTFHDSVDADDGIIDSSGLNGDSFFSSSGPNGIRFTFNAGVLGSLPTSVGIVWTDGVGITTFEAFGPGNVSLGTISAAIADDNFNGGTAEDRFFGVQGLGLIESILINNTDAGIEVDHLQYGLADSSPPPTSVPEPSTILGLGALGLGAFLQRKLAKAKESNQADG
jgi:hypothetical protein